MRCSGTSRFETPIFEFDNGESIGDPDWELRGVVSQVLGFTERAFSQPDRSTSTNRRHSMQAHRRQSSLSRDGKLSQSRI